MQKVKISLTKKGVSLVSSQPEGWGFHKTVYMKYLKKFQTNTDYQTFKSSSEYVEPNVSVIENDNTIFYEPVKSPTLITFTVNGAEYQAEEGMTFYDWAMSEYYDSSCRLTLGFYNLRDDIIQSNISPGDSRDIVYGAGATITPSIFTDTIIQPITYIIDFSDFE